MRYFILNFNTTDFLKYKVLNSKTLSMFPYIVEVAFNNCYTGEFVSVECGNTLLELPPGVVVSKGAFDFHGIDGKSGQENRKEMFEALANDIAESDYVVSHNIEFTLTVLKAELMRHGLELPNTKSICTMKDTSEFVGIPSDFKPGEFKFPTLPELYEKIFGVKIGKPVAAADSVEVTSKCLEELLKRGVLPIDG